MTCTKRSLEMTVMITSSPISLVKRRNENEKDLQNHCFFMLILAVGFIGYAMGHPEAN